MKIAAGSIKGSLFVYDFDVATKTLSGQFSVQNHIGPISSIRMDERGFLVTGGEDESVKLYKVKKNQEIGSVFAVTGRANALELSRHFVLVSSEDGMINIVGKKDMKVYHSLKVSIFKRI